MHALVTVRKVASVCNPWIRVAPWPVAAVWVTVAVVWFLRCGAVLDEAAADGSTMIEASDKQRRAYLEALCRTVPYHVVQPVLAKPSESSVQHLRVEGSVMVADLVGFTAVCERFASEGSEGLSALSTLLDQLFSALLEKGIFPFSGYVVHFGGDSVTTVFYDGAPERRAVAAALTMQRLMRQEIRALIGEGSRDLMLRVGVASGSVHLPILGDVNRRVTAATGSTAHRALLMQKLAQPDEVVVDLATWKELEDEVTVRQRHGEAFVLTSLKRWPPSLPLVEDLESRVQTDVDKKIALLEPFVPEPLARRLRTTPTGWRLEGELRELTVLFADLAGLQRREDLEAGLRVARSIPRTIHKYGGVFTKIDLAPRGHRIMGLFGLSAPTENDGERAILAALELIARIKSLGVDSPEPTELRVGIHSGLAYFGAIGSMHKFDMTAIGDTVNTAARVVSLASAFEVLVTESVLAPVRELFRTSRRGPVRVKGKSMPLSLHAVHSMSGRSARYVQQRNRGRLLVGRADERRQLFAAVDRAIDGQPQLVAVCGEAGAGKSRLLGDAVDRFIEKGGRGVLGRCAYANRTVPLAPVVAMFANYLGFTSGDSDTYRRERLRTLLDEHDIGTGAAELVALLQPVVRDDGSTESSLDLADTQAHERVVGAVMQFVIDRLSDGPLLLVVEDLQHADSLTLKLAARITSTFERELALMVLLTYRPEPTLREIRRVVPLELRLGRLDPEAADELVGKELHVERVAPELSAFLWRRTRGNPADLVELVRFLGDRQLLRIRAGRAAVAGKDPSLLEAVVPKSMAHVALARLDMLGEVERHLLRTAAAIGQRFSRELLDSVSQKDVEPDLLESALARLISARVLSADNGEKPGYLFRDDVIRAVAYETMPAEERAAMHCRIADAIEASAPGQDRLFAATLALHREKAGQLNEASRWIQRAIQVSASLAQDRAVLELMDHHARIQIQLGGDALLDRAQCAHLEVLRLVATARTGSALQAVAVGRQLSLEYSGELDDGTRAVVDYWLGDALANLGKPDKAHARLLRAYEHSNLPALRCDAARRLASIYAGAQDQAATETWLGNARAQAEDDRYRLAQIEMVRAHLHLFLGQARQAGELFERVAVEAAGRGDLVTSAAARSDLARCALADRRFAEAERGFQQAIELDRALGHEAREAFNLCHLGQTLLWAGRIADAVEPLESSLLIARELGSSTIECEALVHLGLTVALTRDPEEGKVLCEEGYRGAVRTDQREVEIAADLHLLRIALLREDADGVAAALRSCAAHDTHLAPTIYRQVHGELCEQARALGYGVDTGPARDD